MAIITAYTKCPKCETLYEYSEMIQENTSPAEYWSDGFCMAPDRKDIIDFAKCPNCGTFFWLKENQIQEPGDLSEIKNLENWWSLDNIGSVEIDFLKEAFRASWAKSNEKEVALRIKLWHAINHINRKYESQSIFKKIKQKIFESADFKDSHKQYNALLSLKVNNLIRLANLLKLDEIENPNNLLFTEIYRELGDFSKAMIYCHRAETTSHEDANRIMLLKQLITSKSKLTYKL